MLMKRPGRVFAALFAAAFFVALVVGTVTPERATVAAEHFGIRGSLDTTGQTLRMINVPVPAPFGLGVSIASDCNANLFYTNYLVPELYRISPTGALHDSVFLHTASGAPVHIDEICWDQTRLLLWGVEDVTFRIFLVNPSNGLCTPQFMGLVQNPPIRVSDGLAFDPTDGTLWHSPDVSDSIAHFTTGGVYLGSIVPRGPTGSPDRDVSGIVVGANNRMYVGHDGQGRITVINKLTGAWIRDLVTLPGRVQGMECDAMNFAPNVVLWVKNGFNNTLTALQLDSGSCVCNFSPDTCQFPYTQLDMGNLSVCAYPTLLSNPGHGLSGIAWLGPCVTGETTPYVAGQDSCTDGVTFLHTPWTPCSMETVMVNVTAGPNFSRYQGCGGHLYLNAWKDGNLNGSFCDEIVCDSHVASEWIIQDLLVAPGHYVIPVLDPGIRNIGVYTGVFRFRLTSQPAGRFGFGRRDTVACPNATCGTFGLDFLGEVEDYSLPDFQLAVDVSSFDAAAGDGSVVLRWVTASESANDHFEIRRDGENIARVPSQGNGPVQHTYSFTDGRLTNGREYTYTLVAVDVNGNHNELRGVNATPTAGRGVVNEYVLRQNYPNPFNPYTEISYDLKEAGLVRITVHNVLGEEVARLVNAHLPQGRHSVSFDGSKLSSGLYLYRLEVNGFTAQRKMLLMK